MSKSITFCKFAGNNKGVGVYAKQKITAGTSVWIEDPSVYANRASFTRAEINNMSEEGLKRLNTYGMVMDNGEYVQVDPYLENWVRYGGEIDYESAPCNGNFINHSCDPNLVWVSHSELQAWRDIEEGEELSFDYACEDFDVAPFVCGCGSKLCRKQVGGQEWRNRELRERYGEYFKPHILQMIKLQYGSDVHE